MTEGVRSSVVNGNGNNFGSQPSWRRPDSGNNAQPDTARAKDATEIDEILRRRVGDKIIDAVEDAVGERLGSPGRDGDRWITLAELYSVLKSNSLGDSVQQPDDVPVNIPMELLVAHIKAREKLKEVIPECHHYVFEKPEIVFSLCHRLRSSQLIYGGEVPSSAANAASSPPPVVTPTPTPEANGHGVDVSPSDDTLGHSLTIPPPPPPLAADSTPPADATISPGTNSIQVQAKRSKVQVHSGMLLSAVDLHRLFEPRVVITNGNGKPAQGQRKGTSPRRRPKSQSSYVMPEAPKKRGSSRSRTSPSMDGKALRKQPMERSATDLTHRSSTSRRSRSSAKHPTPKAVTHPPWTNRLGMSAGHTSPVPNRSHVRQAKPIFNEWLPHGEQLTPQLERALARRRARERGASERAKDPPAALWQIPSESTTVQFSGVQPQIVTHRANTSAHHAPTYTSAPVTRWRGKSPPHSAKHRSTSATKH